MRTVREIYRRHDARLEPIPSPSDHEAYTEAYHGSKALLHHLLCNGAEPDPPRRKRSFEEQLALVEQGKAQCVEWNIRLPDPDMTLGGVCW